MILIHPSANGKHGLPGLAPGHVLARARRRYLAAPLTARPNLDDPTSYVGLFPLRDLLALARCCRWPLSAADISYLRRA
jgi:hypothetical protein